MPNTSMLSIARMRRMYKWLLFFSRLTVALQVRMVALHNQCPAKLPLLHREEEENDGGQLHPQNLM